MTFSNRVNLDFGPFYDWFSEQFKEIGIVKLEVLWESSKDVIWHLTESTETQKVLWMKKK